MRTDDEEDCGGAAVRIGFGDVESIDCEGGRAMYITGGEWASPKEWGAYQWHVRTGFLGRLASSSHPCVPRGCCPLEPCLRRLGGDGF